MDNLKDFIRQLRAEAYAEKEKHSTFLLADLALKAAKLLEETNKKQKYIINRLDESVDCIHQATDSLANSSVEEILKMINETPVEEKCNSYITYHYMYPRYKEEGHCLGTKEVEPCNCHGLKRFCDFYKED